MNTENKEKIEIVKNKENTYSQLRAMKAIMSASFRSLTRSPSTIAFSFFFPVIFLFAFGFINSGGVKLTVAVAPGSDELNPVYTSLLRSQYLQLEQGKAFADINKELSRGSVDAIIGIERKEKGGKPFFQVHVRTSTASAEKGRFFSLIIEEIVDKINLADEPDPTPVAEIRRDEIAGRKYSMIDFILPGQIGFSVLSTAVFGTAFVFLNLRNTLVIKRFFATPIHRSYIVLGEALSRLVFSLLGTLFIIVLGHFVFHFTLAHGIVTVINMTVLSALGLLVFMGIGFTISGVAKSESTVPVMANIVTMPQFILSGTFFSIELFPKWLQYVSKVLPLTYLNDALRKVSFEGAGLLDVSKEILILLAWGIVIYIIAGKTFRWE